MARELVQDLALVGETPLDYVAVLEAAEHRLLGKASGDDFIPDLRLLLIFLGV